MVLHMEEIMVCRLTGQQCLRENSLIHDGSKIVVIPWRSLKIESSADVALTDFMHPTLQQAAGGSLDACQR